MTTRMRTALTISILLTVCMFTAIGVEQAALAAGRDSDLVAQVMPDAGAPLAIPAPPPDSLGDAHAVPVVPRAATPMAAPSVDNPTGTLVELVTFARTGKGRLAIGCAIVLLVWLLRNHILKRVAFFGTKLGGYVAGFGTAGLLYIGGGLSADLPLTANMIADALVAGFTAGSQWETISDLAKSKIPPVMRMSVASLVVVTLGVYFSVSACGGKPFPVTGTVIDCLTVDSAAKTRLKNELTPIVFGEMPDWDVVTGKAIEAGAEVGGCVIAELVQHYLAPAPGRMAPAVDKGHEAREALETFRAKHARGATFRTADGDL